MAGFEEREGGYRAEGRIEVDSAFVSNPKGRWFLPGAGKSESFKDLEIGPEMVVIPAGEFWMGSRDNEGIAKERPRHNVTIPKPLAIGRYPVTVEEYMAAVKAGSCNPPEWLEKGSDYHFETGSDDHYKKLGSALTGERNPIVGVSWHDAEAFVKWLSDKSGKSYRLLSEAEWEYACRAGTGTVYSFGDEESGLARYAWYSGNSNGKPHPVGEKKANQFGLHDMYGNVWEWCQDCWNRGYHAAPADGSAWTSVDCRTRALRGGSWPNLPIFLRSAYRFMLTAEDRINDTGFRVARTL
jgi:formylglycine-generating enzyme required for sulfatase activity